MLQQYSKAKIVPKCHSAGWDAEIAAENSAETGIEVGNFAAGTTHEKTNGFLGK